MYEEWVTAEHFYTSSLPFIVIFLAVCFFAYIFFLSYMSHRKKILKLGNYTFALIIIFCVMYTVIGHTSHRFWVDQNDYIHAGIREYSFIFGWKNSEDPQIVRSLGKSNLLYSNLQELTMYDVEEVTHSFNHDYVGSRENDHYFSLGEKNQYVYRIRGEINWKSQKSEIKGMSFTLNDKRFKELGFVDDFNIIFDSLSVPYEHISEVNITDNQRIIPIDDVYGNWIFSDQKY